MRTTSGRVLGTLVLAGLIPLGSAASADDGVAAAKVAVEKYAGPQTTWEGPTSAPKPAKGMTLVYLSGDEQNDISREYGLSMKEAAAKLGWTLTVIDGKGSPPPGCPASIRRSP